MYMQSHFTINSTDGIHLNGGNEMIYLKTRMEEEYNCRKNVAILLQ